MNTVPHMALKVPGMTYPTCHCSTVPEEQITGALPDLHERQLVIGRGIYNVAAAAQQLSHCVGHDGFIIHKQIGPLKEIIRQACR